VPGLFAKVNVVQLGKSANALMVPTQARYFHCSQVTNIFLEKTSVQVLTVETGIRDFCFCVQDLKRV